MHHDARHQLAAERAAAIAPVINAHQDARPGTEDDDLIAGVLFHIEHDHPTSWPVQELANAFVAWLRGDDNGRWYGTTQIQEADDTAAARAALRAYVHAEPEPPANGRPLWLRAVAAIVRAELADGSPGAGSDDASLSDQITDVLTVLGEIATSPGREQ